MERDILAEVISAEKEIQKCIELEKTKAHEWIERVRREAEEELAREEERLKGSFGKAMEGAKGDAADKASLVMREAAAKADRLEKMNDEVLVGVIMKRLNGIVPG